MESSEASVVVSPVPAVPTRPKLALHSRILTGLGKGIDHAQ